MALTVLGVDPGKQTGVACLEVAGGRFKINALSVMRDDEFTTWMRNRMQMSAPDLVAVEDWSSYAGPRGRKGASQAAFATGYTVGTVLSAGLAADRLVMLPRPTVLAGLRLKPNASKAACREAVQLLLGLAGEINDHVADAAAVAIVGSGRGALPGVGA